MSRAASRRGVTLVGVMVILLMLIGIGLGLSNLARQSRRSSHWYFQSQLAFDLAGAALREVHQSMVDGNSPTRLQAGRAPAAMSTALTELYEKISSGAAGTTVTMLTSPGAQDPPALAALLDETVQGFDPQIEVRAKLLTVTPLWSGTLDGIPAVPREKKGTVQIIAVASVKSEAGMRVERTIIVERELKLISVLPSLLGRFSLFVNGAPAQDPNFVSVTMDEEAGAEPGQGRVNGPQPLIVRSKAVSVPVVAPASRDLDRSTLGAVAPDFLDRQGWIYLGGSGGTGAAGEWLLNLAHGWGAGGESPMLPGYFRRAHYKGSEAGTNSFLQRMALKIASFKFCKCKETRGDGLYHLQHGLADNYDAIGLDPALLKRCRDGFGRGKLLEFTAPPALQCSALRLFGTPDQFSPTLVFGAVSRGMFRKARIVLNLVDHQQPPCKEAGKLLWLVPRKDTYPPGLQGILDEGFESSEENYKSQGTGPASDTYMSSLNVVLNANEKGQYSPNGELMVPVQPSAPAGWATSQRFGAMGATSLPDPKGLPEDIRKALWEGRVENSALFGQTLDRGMAAFGKTLGARCTFSMTAETFLTRYFASGKVRVPGVVYISGAPLELPAVTEVTEGGMIIGEKGIKLTGNVKTVATPTAPGEPLTFVALDGDIDIGGGAREIEAYLVANVGTVRWSGDVKITGGVACGQLDLASIRGRSANREILYTGEHDALDPARLEASLRVFYSGEGKLAVTGVEP